MPCLRLWVQAFTPIGKGTLADDDALLRRISGLGDEFEAVRAELLAGFAKDLNGRWAHPLLVHLYNEAGRRSKKSKNAADRRWNESTPQQNQAPEPARKVDLFTPNRAAPPPVLPAQCSRNAASNAGPLTTVPN